MKLSLIINTCVAHEGAGQTGNLYRSAPYTARLALLKDRILPTVLTSGWDEIFVSGGVPISLAEEFRDPRLTFLAMPPAKGNRWDALIQREIAARHSTGDILCFSHDDHLPPKAEEVQYAAEDLVWDILVPKRIHGVTGATMNNGKADGYMGGHSYLMRRSAWATYPLTKAPDEWWDLYMTNIWKSLGLSIVWTDALTHVDLEAKEGES